MAVIGNTPINQNFVAGADQFSGNGSQTAFTMSRNVNTVFDLLATVSNVVQDPFTAYTVSGNTITFDSAPPAGTNNIDVVYRATNVQTFVPSPLSVGATQVVNGSVTNDKLSLAANASNVMTALNASGSAPIFAARAWVNFNGTGTVAIRASGNVSSITDNGTGNYTINFTNSLVDASYSYLAKSTRVTNNTAASTDMNTSAVCVDPTISSIVLKTGFNSGVNTTEDSPNATLAIFR